MKYRCRKGLGFCLAFLLLFPVPARADDQGFAAWLAGFAQEARQAGISPQTLARTLPYLTFDENVIELDRKQPESRLTFDAYVKGVVSTVRVGEGRKMAEEYDSTLREIAARTGVPPSVIVALWAVESNFGENPGTYRILDSLASLAYEGRRAAFFKKELIEALKVVDEEGLEIDALQGSWAGAMGQCQFMPSTYRRYAVDFDENGKRDIWDSEVDVLASIANYIKAEGWTPGLPWGREVHLTRPVPADLIGAETVRDVGFWKQSGVRLLSGGAVPEEGVEASLIRPDGPGGRAFLIYDNFRALMRWNRSTYFAASVGMLADAIEEGS